MDVAVRDAMVPREAGRSFFQSLRDLGTTSVELLVDPGYGLPAVALEDGSKPFSVRDERETLRFKSRLDAEGIRVSALLLMTDFSGDHAAEHVSWSIRAVHAAAELGAPAVRIDTWTANKTLTPAEVRDRFVRRVSEVLRATAGGVDLGIENHGHLSNDPRFLDDVFAAVNDSRLGLTLDTGNFYWFGHPLDDLYRLIERYAPRARHTHIKNINYPADLAQIRREVGLEYGKYCCPVDRGNIDMARVIRTLREAGYDRDLCIEDESLGKVPAGERPAIVRRQVAWLREQIPA